VADSRKITGLLGEWRSGNPDALERLIPLVYDSLRRLAERRLRNEASGHTLQATELVHEVFARLVDADVEWNDRAHFLAIAARLMRRILVDHSRRRTSEKRGGGATPVTLNEELAVAGDRPEMLLSLDQAMCELEEHDQRKAKVVELHFFGGLTYAETAEVLGISEATVDRDLRMAKAWLAAELADPR